MTSKTLAEKAGVWAGSIARMERGQSLPTPGTISKLARALNYPPEFLTGDELDEVESGPVSFRSFSRMTAKERNAALASGTLGLMLNQWLEARFNLPKPDLLDLSHETDPELAADHMREYWALADRPVPKLISLLEAKGVRVFSLSENTANVNAFSFWKGGMPFIFLNNFKSAESSRYDMAHELGHLVLHAHDQPKGHHVLEREANQFAAAFLMPPSKLRKVSPAEASVKKVIELKKVWGVSAMSMTRRLYQLGYLSERHYRASCINLAQLGYRRSEPDGMERETSPLWRKAFTMLWKERITKEDIARDLCIPFDEFEMLVNSLAPDRPQLPQDGTSKLRPVTS